MDGLQRLQGLHADLQAFAETRLVHIERLWLELQDTIDDFRKLLDKSTPTPSAREAYNSGKISSDGQDFAIGDEFRHLSRAIGTALEIDEVVAGELLISGTSGSASDDEYLVTDSISRYHDRRDLVLQCLRIVLDESQNLEHEDDIRMGLQDIVAQVLDTKNGPPSNGSVYALKCIKSMEDVEQAYGKINEQIQSKAILTQLRGPEFYATLEFQKGSLFKQHEALGAIVTMLFRGDYTISEDLRKLKAVVKRWQRLDGIWIHYLPVFSAAFRRYGSPEGSVSVEDAKSLNQSFSNLSADNMSSQARPLQAVLEIWWTAEYSGWSREPTANDKEAEKRSQTIKAALDDHALEYLLLVCSSMHVEMWRYPARQELIALLVGERGGLSVDFDQQTSSYFYELLMESIENFAEAWITNMPDDIRQLKNQEDDERLVRITTAQDAIGPGAQREDIGRLHLESFLVLIAFGFEHRPDAAEQFWEDLDGNLYGFLQWSSKRQTVPRVSAFCEMLCAISEGPENAVAAHKFLLDESIVVPSSRTRRVPTMNYHQIFAELELYARKVHERTSNTQPTHAPKTTAPELNEMESPVMLSSYLRLLSYLCRQNAPTREYLLVNAGYDFPRTLLMLASGPIPTYLRATVFRTLESLLTEKTDHIASDIWRAVDDWVSSNHDLQTAVKQTSPAEKTLAHSQATLSSIAASFDQYDAFVELLRSLITPIPSAASDGVKLPFPNDLGADYRTPGISPYVDFICGQVFTRRLREIADETQAMLCSYHCLDFIAACLESFNENYVAMIDINAKQVDGLSTTNQDLLYAQSHPFSRVMQWLFEADMNKAVLKLLRGKSSDLDSCLPDAPVVLTTQRIIDVINLVLVLQPTYFDIIKPLLKDSATLKSIKFVGYTSFEESVAANCEILLDLCQYAVSPHLQLCMRSLTLLQRLTGSPRLNAQFVSGSGGKGRRLVDMIGSSSETTLRSVANILAGKFATDMRELEDGFEAPGYLMKDAGLAFLNACLAVQTELPSIAHLLLGFGRLADRLTISDAMDQGISLFNAIAALVIDYPDGQDGIMMSWLIHIKSASMRVLQSLWSAPVSSDIIIGQLRRIGFLSAQFTTQTVVSHSTVWDDLQLSNPAFWYSTSAEALAEFFVARSCLYDYTAREIDSIGNESLLSLQKQIITTLQGRSVAENGTTQRHISIFDLFDFADLDINVSLQLPQLTYFNNIDFEVYKADVVDGLPPSYDIAVVTELLQSVQGQLLDQQTQSAGAKAVDQDALSEESDFIISLLQARNRWTLVQVARRQALHNYVDMIISAIDSRSLDMGNRTQFCLHILQIILPKLDTLVVEEAPEAMELARAADALLLSLSRDTPSSNQGRIDAVVTERLFQLFRISLEGITLATDNFELRATLYSICTQYLARISHTGPPENDLYQKARSNSMDCVRSASQRLVSILSDDAEDGSDTCRLHALSLLSMLTFLAWGEKSNLLVEALAKHNVVEILLEPLRNVVADFSNTSIKSRPYLLTLFEARMFLLLQISRSRTGAIALLESGYIQACRDSLIFRADPDLGMDLEASITTSNPTSGVTNGASGSTASRTSALHNYFQLLSTTLRVLLSTFISRGPDNEQLQHQIRTFILNHRANMVGVFKKAAGVSGYIKETKTKELIDECVRCYVGLGTGVGFVEFEDDSGLNGIRNDGGFS